MAKKVGVEKRPKTKIRIDSLRISLKNTNLVNATS